MYLLYIIGVYSIFFLFYIQNNSMNILHTIQHSNYNNFFRGSNLRYRNSLVDIPRRTRINMVSAPRTTYYPADYVDRDPPSLSYSRSRSAIGDPSISQELLVRGRETSRLIPRSTVATETNEKRKMQHVFIRTNTIYYIIILYIIFNIYNKSSNN